jgi:LysR family transcriptional activator of nhaA
VLEREVARQYGVELLGRMEEVRERYYVITLHRKVEHPALAEITRAAREEMFAGR